MKDKIVIEDYEGEDPGLTAGRHRKSREQYSPEKVQVVKQLSDLLQNSERTNVKSTKLARRPFN